MIAVACMDMTIQLWDLATGICNAILIGYSHYVPNIIFSPNGSMIASESWHGSIQLWDLDSMACQHILHSETFYWDMDRDVAFSPQGHQLATTTFSGSVRLWDVKSGECQMILVGHADFRIRVMYSLDGDTLISCGGDTLRIWDVTTDHCQAVLREPPSTIIGINQWIDQEGICLIANIKGRSFGSWKVIKGQDGYRLSANWVMASGALEVQGASIQGVRRLSMLNTQLLKQRGAEGEPMVQLREVAKKIIAMTSVVSKLKQPARAVTDVPSKVGLPDEQEEPSV
jgi:WD40 repeat protein